MGLKYEPALDGLRAVAALVVVMFHCGMPFLWGGGRGVDVFFVLSGYLITGILLRQDRFNLKGFWSARIRRLLPALVLVTIATLAAAPMYAVHVGLTPLEAIYALTYTMNLAATTGHRLNPLSHTWSLAQEMQFYLLWPFVISALSKSRPRVLLLLGWALITALRFAVQGDLNISIYSPLTRCSGLMLGALIVFCPAPRNFLGLVGALLIAITLILGNPGWSATYGEAIAEIGAALLIGNLASQESLWKKVLSYKPLVRLGVVSYGIYLWHFPLLMWATPLLVVGADQWQIKLAFVLPATILLAFLSYDLLEVRFTSRRKFREPVPHSIPA